MENLSYNNDLREVFYISDLSKPPYENLLELHKNVIKLCNILSCHITYGLYKASYNITKEDTFVVKEEYRFKFVFIDVVKIFNFSKNIDYCVDRKTITSATFNGFCHSLTIWSENLQEVIKQAEAFIYKLSNCNFIIYDKNKKNK